MNAVIQGVTVQVVFDSPSEYPKINTLNLRLSTLLLDDAVVLFESTVRGLWLAAVIISKTDKKLIIKKNQGLGETFSSDHLKEITNE